MVRNIFLKILIAVSFLSCKKSEFIIIQNTQSKIKVSIEKNSIDIEHPEYIASTELPFVLEDKDSTYLYYYDDAVLQFHVFNLSSLNYSYSIQTEQVGSNGTGEITDYFVQAKDSIVTLSYDQVSFLDSLGKLYAKSLLDQSDDDHFIHNKGSLGSYRLFFDQEKNEIHYRLNYHMNREKHAYYENEIYASIDLDQPVIKPYPIFYSKLYNEKYFGLMSHPNWAFTPNLFIYNFPAEPNIYVYDRFSSESAVYGGSSDFFDDQIASDISRNTTELTDELAAMKISPIYLEVIPDEYRKLYYRFCYHPIAEKYTNSDGVNFMQEKKISLMIFDKAFNVVEEVMMDETKYTPHGAFVTKKGLWVSKRNNEKENVKSYDVFLFQLEG